MLQCGIALALLVLPMHQGPSYSLNIPVEPDLPFRAEYRVVQKSGATERVTVGQVWRDSAGRTRQDTVITPETMPLPVHIKLTFSTVKDPLREQHFLIDHHSKAVTMLPYPTQFEGDSDRPLPNQRTAEEEKLGSKEIEGLVCDGYRSDLKAGGSIETWVSRELGLVVLLSVSAPTGDLLLQVTEIVSEEPEISLFEIPDDYGRPPES